MSQPTTPSGGQWGELKHPRANNSQALAMLGKIVRYVLLIGLAILFLFPFYIIVRNSLMTQPEITAFDAWQWWPESPQWGNYREVFDDDAISMATGLRVSALLAIVNLVMQTLFASMAGYALARIPFRGRDVIFFLILLTLMIPGAVTFVPTYVVVSELGGINTLWGIVVPGLFNAFATFLFRQFYLDFPTEIEEAGRLDGNSYFGVYWKLLLPNSLGIMAALGILSFISSWNAFLWPVIVGQSESTRTVQVVLSSYLTAQTIDLTRLFAGAAIGAIPLIIVFLVLQRYIVQGVRMSGIKG
ncbi:MAG: carbohydrate ABC transporter permease [Chloroflexota bacterium]|nr:carbohydrate ABC transporter permease [Chloroflexota bacterium]